MISSWFTSALEQPLTTNEAAFYLIFRLRLGLTIYNPDFSIRIPLET